jgi:hypothetical protein
VREPLAQLDEGVPPATGTPNNVIPRAAGPVRRLGDACDDLDEVDEG